MGSATKEYLMQYMNLKGIGTIIKAAVLLVFWFYFTVCLARHHEHEEENNIIAVAAGTATILPVDGINKNKEVKVELEGSFYASPTRTSDTSLTISLQIVGGANVGQPIIVAIDAENVGNLHALVERAFLLTYTEDIEPGSTLQVTIESNYAGTLPLLAAVDSHPINTRTGIICGLVLLGILYVMIIWEFIHRTFAAVLCSTLGIGVLSCLDHKPSMETIFEWVNAETLLLLFGMMILVAVLAETGLFDYLAVLAYQITKGQIWPLITCLCAFTAVVSAFLDNVTTVLLMAPVSIRLCEVLLVNPRPVLISMVIFSNIGGAMTPVGDPPNVIIASNQFVQRQGVDFVIFSANMLCGTFYLLFVTYLHLRIYCHLTKCLTKSADKDHELIMWKKTAARTGSVTLDEAKIKQLVNERLENLKKQGRDVDTGLTSANYQQTLIELQLRYPIRNKTLLVKAVIVLCIVVFLFCFHSVDGINGLDLGWIALLGAMLLLILHEVEDFEALLHHVEWATLLFFFALFVLMEVLTELGLIDYIGAQTQLAILAVSPKYQLTTALLLILWVSALVSAFVDNIPLTTMMIKVVTELAENEELGLPARPLIFALALGACLGGNGTLIGASANVVTAGIAAQHGYPISFFAFFKMGFQVMIMNMILVSLYLILVYVLIKWY